jgi:hypothetical protein
MVITTLVILVSSLNETPADEKQILHVHKKKWISCMLSSG